MIPSAWVGIVLVLGSFRLLRLIGWDDFPPIYRLRAWVTQERWVREGLEVEMPGKTPESEVGELRVAYGRPLLAHFLHCPFCVGFWIAAGVYVSWLLLPTATLYVAAPFALSGAIALIAKNWDP